MVKIGIYGASGYTGQELLRLLLRHGGVEVTAVTSRRYAEKAVSDIYPVFSGMTDLSFMDASPEDLAKGADMVFVALPHGASMEVTPRFLAAGKKVIDLSADFRLHDVAAYEKWYGKRAAPEALGEAVYGIPELYRAAVKKARFVANPGCYPTSIILGLAPALKGKCIDTASIIADSKSGVSGAGREPRIGSLFCEVDGGFKAYNIGKHRHTPEIEQELSLLAGQDVTISFTPHLLPVKRGILSTIYATLKTKTTVGELLEKYRAFYQDEQFVRIYKEGTFPDISSVAGSNFCDIGIAVDGRVNRVVIVSAIDNLMKGASGQALQNMNLMCGFAEDTGLTMLPVFP